LKAVEVADNIRNSMDKCMENRAGSRCTTLGEVNIRRGIFQGDSRLSHLLFIIVMIPLTHNILRQHDAGY